MFPITVAHELHPSASTISCIILLYLVGTVGTQDFEYGDFGYPNALSNGIGIDPDLGLRFDGGPFNLPQEPLTRPRARQPQRRPNVVVILADDMGWNDVSFTGSGQIPTPNLDALASAGVILQNHYVQPFCTPSRAALLTGMYPIHSGMQHYVIRSREPWGLPLDFKLLPQHLKDLGYRTHLIGKWHLGQFKKEFLPTRRGFDSHLGYYNGYIDYFTHNHTYKRDSALDFFKDEVPYHSEEYATRLFTDRAEEIIRDHDVDNPLFLYFAHLAVHRATDRDPFQAPQETIDKFSYVGDRNRTTFAAMLAELDVSVGRVVEALAKKGILDNTIILFSSDNGGQATAPMENTGTNFPLRGQKRTLFEGGTRVPAFVWSPLIRRPRRVFYDMVHIVDWLPTIYSLAGGDPRNLGRIDGMNVWGAVSDGMASPRTEILYNIDPVQRDLAIRVGRYKLLYGPMYNLTEWYDNRGFGYASHSVLERYMDKSAVARVLRDLGYWWKGREEDYSRRPTWQWREETRVHCGNPSSATACNPSEQPCLFDLATDPCEYNNLYGQLTQVARYLLSRLEAHARSARPINNKPDDYSFQPNATWGPWIR
ncbi:arylsulfatase B [Galendromus occidentalis]|uniref:Arylsulfatase B n=1 Tax=Galendromus occidentalis TaxID=34638 RepID=A0AAJ7L639_9ACAR|nr:arylsulfatase B [Galendromus occidentalis]